MKTYTEAEIQKIVEQIMSEAYKHAAGQTSLHQVNLFGSSYSLHQFRLDGITPIGQNHELYTKVHEALKQHKSVKLSYCPCSCSDSEHPGACDNGVEIEGQREKALEVR